MKRLLGCLELILINKKMYSYLFYEHKHIKFLIFLLILSLHTIVLFSNQPLLQKIHNYFNPKNAVENMYEKVVETVTNLIDLDIMDKSNVIVFEKFYEGFYLLRVGSIAAVIDPHKIQKIAALKESLIKKTYNLFILILESPLQLSKQKNDSRQAVLHDLIPLAVVSGPTLYDILAEQWGEIKETEKQNVIAQKYSSCINVMYKTCVSIARKRSLSEDDEKMMHMALHYGQQAFKVMQRYKLLLVADANIDVNALVHWLNLPQSDYTAQLIEGITGQIEVGLQGLMDHIQKYKIYGAKNTAADYKNFMEDVTFHAYVIATLYNALYMQKQYNVQLDIIKEYLQLLTAFLFSVQDGELVDQMPEALLFRQYKSLFIQTIQNMLTPFPDDVKNDFNPRVQEAHFISNERIEKIKKQMQKIFTKSPQSMDIYRNILVNGYSLDEKQIADIGKLFLPFALEKESNNQSNNSEPITLKNVLHQIQKANYHVTSAQWHFRLWGLLKNKQLLDLAENDGVTKIIDALNSADNLNFLSLKKASEKSVTDSTYVQLKKEVQKLIDHLHELQDIIYDYLKNVLYTQTPTPLYEAHIKTGQIVIDAIQKAATKLIEMTKFLQIKISKQKIFNFKELDNAYDKQKMFM